MQAHFYNSVDFSKSFVASKQHKQENTDSESVYFSDNFQKISLVRNWKNMSNYVITSSQYKCSNYVDANGVIPCLCQKNRVLILAHKETNWFAELFSLFQDFKEATCPIHHIGIFRFLCNNTAVQPCSKKTNTLEKRKDQVFIFYNQTVFYNQWFLYQWGLSTLEKAGCCWNRAFRKQDILESGVSSADNITNIWCKLFTDRVLLKPPTQLLLPFPLALNIKSHKKQNLPLV